MKQLTFDEMTAEIRETVDELLKHHDTVTTLEVKEAIRDKGYQCFQTVVSGCLSNNHEAWGLDWEFNGRYRYYFKKDRTFDVTDGTTTITLVAYSENHAKLMGLQHFSGSPFSALNATEHARTVNP